ncbi:MAG: purine-nucleoside phosphorylase [Flavobacteriales bacterium]|nr:purine-nucleoside phosphorylase [Flavobacteriales bacterium]
MMQAIHKAADYLRFMGIETPDVGIVLGTGLGALADKIEVAIRVPYEDIPFFPTSTVEFHKGRLIFGTLYGKKVLAMQGRFHLYEGYSAAQVVFPIRVMRQLGIKKLLLSNAAGGLNPIFNKGELMCIIDHINLLPDNPLRGANPDALGPRFPDMSAPYSVAMNKLLEDAANRKGIKLHKGVYASVMGPNLETRAEYRFLKKIGADAVGMSTVPEVIAARHMSMECCAISVITDLCDPDNLEPANIQDIIANAAKGEAILDKLIADFLENLKAFIS